MRPFEIWDVFTTLPLAGNPLAVVFEADDLAPQLRQTIAAEFNLSETIFFAAPMAEGDTARGFIHTPKSELPFAGHPTVGGAIALAARQGRTDLRIVLPAGPVAVDISAGAGDTPHAAFDAPKLPQATTLDAPLSDLAALVGLDAGDLDIARWAPSIIDSGPRFLVLPLAGVDALTRARFDRRRAATLGDGPKGVYLIAADPDGGLHARMFAPLEGIEEDPATGSAAVGLAALLADGLTDGDHAITVRQGEAMGRPSTLALKLTLAGGVLIRVRLAGSAVLIASGTLDL